MSAPVDKGTGVLGFLRGRAWLSARALRIWILVLMLVCKPCTSPCCPENCGHVIASAYQIRYLPKRWNLGLFMACFPKTLKLAVFCTRAFSGTITSSLPIPPLSLADCLHVRGYPEFKFVSDWKLHIKVLENTLINKRCSFRSWFQFFKNASE